MNENHKQDIFKKAVDIFQGEYAAPTKAFIWALCQA